MNKEKAKIEKAAIKELKKLIKDPDKKIKLRAISLLLRHSNKVSSKDDDLLDLDNFLE